MWLKVSFKICTYITKILIEIPPCAKGVNFITESALLRTNLPFYEVNEKGLAHGGISKIFY